jgi:hypothetical protein
MSEGELGKVNRYKCSSDVAAGVAQTDPGRRTGVFECAARVLFLRFPTISRLLSAQCTTCLLGGQSDKVQELGKGIAMDKRKRKRQEEGSQSVVAYVTPHGSFMRKLERTYIVADA